MKKQALLLSFFAFTCGIIYAQEENTVPDAGNVGIGTTDPEATLDVNGTVKIDSTLIVKDSVTIQSDLRVQEDAHFMNKTEMKDAEVNEKFKANGESEFNGDVKFTNLADQYGLTNSNFLTLDYMGNMSKVPYDTMAYILKGTIHNLPMPDFPLTFCDLASPNDLPNSPYYNNPFWQSMPGKLIVPCPDVNVGIGTLNPATKLDVWGGVSCEAISIGVNPNQLGTKSFHLRAYNNAPSLANATIFLVENQDRALFQINNDGIVRSREIKVNLDAAWPDYVFKPDYSLKPLHEVKQFIDENGHLPNVPSAQEIEADGISLGEMNRVLLEKVEELTLHLIEQQRLLEEQNKRLEILENNK